ncbi:hypothetical protein Zmor_019049 [Zophobas morio]|uniref:Gustatory receptor n=1 Tax=Zophobas morio TaxID=2755281 RepID=A0AA38ICD8_9CUCU|nr:hypothetical protein Zmor_019049 [Zophobas morio]
MTGPITLLFNFGKILALVPSYNYPVTFTQKLYTLIFVTFNFVATVMLSIDRNGYKLYYAKAVVFFLTDVNLLIFVCYSRVSLVLWNKKKWEILINNLYIMISSMENRKVIRYAKICILKLFVEIVVLFAIYMFWFGYFGPHFITQYNIHYFNYYLLYSYNTFVSFILYTILVQYKYVSAFLDQPGCSTLIQKIEQNLYFLKDTTNAVNDTFEWPTTMVISYTVLYILNNLDYIFINSSIQNDNQLKEKILADFALVLLTVIGTFLVVLWSDLISKEAEDLLDKSYILQRSCKNLAEKERFQELSKTIKHNFPRFSAARFFSVNRATILSILGTVTTFFIVLIQLRDYE